MNIKQQLLENPTLVLDTETGGLDPTSSALCSVSVMLPNGKNDKTWFIKPYDKDYSHKALEVNGLTLEYLEVNGVTLDQFKAEFIAYLKDNFHNSTFGSIQLLGHNIAFDIGFLKETFGEEYKKYFHYHFKDSMILANMLKDTQIIPIKQKINLKDLYIYFFGEDEVSKNAHSSLADCLMCLEIYGKMLKLIR
jgi:DNA polymerase III epsilon subunit-like protein